jgi:hypothetical protein
LKLDTQTVTDPADFQRGRRSGGAAKRYLIGGAIRPSRQLSNAPIGAIFSAKQATSKAKGVILNGSGRRAAPAGRYMMIRVTWQCKNCKENSFFSLLRTSSSFFCSKQAGRQAGERDLNPSGSCSTAQLARCKKVEDNPPEIKVLGSQFYKAFCLLYCGRSHCNTKFLVGKTCETWWDLYSTVDMMIPVTFMNRAESSILLWWLQWSFMNLRREILQGQLHHDDMMLRKTVSMESNLQCCWD